jgi:hypothetical protein
MIVTNSPRLESGPTGGLGLPGELTWRKSWGSTWLLRRLECSWRCDKDNAYTSGCSALAQLGEDSGKMLAEVLGEILEEQERLAEEKRALSRRPY